MKRDGWTRLSKPGSSCWAHWVHEASTWQVRHCGHPTANWPYYLIDPGSLCTVVSFNGLGFKTVAVSMDVVERVLAGQLQLTNENCVENIMRVMVTSFGKEVKP